MANPAPFYRGFAAMVFAAAVVPSVGAQSPVADIVSEVNPFIGTTNGGNVFPGATVPFGMVQFSPEATPINPRRPIAAPGGYEYRATAIRGFSHYQRGGLGLRWRIWGCTHHAHYRRSEGVSFY